MLRRALALTALLATVAPPAGGARILCLLGMPSPSHHIFNRVFTTALAERGHQVTVLTSEAVDPPVANHREFVVEGAYESVSSDFNYRLFAEMSRAAEVSHIWDWGTVTCAHTLQSEAARRLLQLSANETFDLIVAEMSYRECVLGFISKFGNPPVVGFTAYPIATWVGSIVGDFPNPAYVNTYSLPYTDHMSFTQRLTNFLLDRYVMLTYYYSYLPQQEEIARRFFGDSVPPVGEILKNVSMAMVNTHFSTHFPQPHVPALVQIGGLHLKPGKPLPKDIEQFLNASDHGAVFFSLGSNVRCDGLGEEVIRSFLDAFAELPQNVLWKFESDTLHDVPPNVKIYKWLPQNDILAHPRVRAFISHGGMLSTTEAVYHGVPIVGIPFLVDQHTNIANAVANGVAVRLDYSDITKRTVIDALGKVINDTSYRERMRRLSAVYLDRPETPLQTAIYWTEYALRHQGAPHLRCASLDLAWYQRLLLDVAAALVAAAAALCLAAWYLLRAVSKMAAPYIGHLLTTAGNRWKDEWLPWLLASGLPAPRGKTD